MGKWIVAPDGWLRGERTRSAALLSGAALLIPLAGAVGSVGLMLLGRVVAEGVTQPFMFVLSDHSGESEAETRPVMANIRSIYDRLPSDHRLRIVIRGANHFMFSDGAMLRSPLAMRVMGTLGIVHLDGRRQVAVTAHCICTFFDVYLKGAPASELKSQSEYPEIDIIP